MNSISAQNLEDAANIATEFIYSLDNLPGEVRFLLEEMKAMDGKVQDLQNQIDTDSARFIRWNLRASSATFPIPPSPNGNVVNPELLPAKIASSYAEIQTLSDEKVHLAQKIVELIRRTRVRLDIELGKVRVLTGETVEPPPSVTRSVSANININGGTAINGAPVTLSAPPGVGGATTPGSPGGGAYLNGRDTAEKISESLRNALMVGGTATALPVEGSRSNKRRKTGTTGTTTPLIKLLPSSRSMSPSTTVATPKKASSVTSAAAANHYAPTHRSSRLSRAVKLIESDGSASPSPSGRDSTDADADGDADDEDAEGAGGTNRNTSEVAEEDEDDHLYCFCQKPSYGDMIACDDADCPYEWFHLPCLGLKNEPSLDRWYCPHCAEKQTGAVNVVGRKGRKKA